MLDSKLVLCPSPRHSPRVPYRATTLVVHRLSLARPCHSPRFPCRAQPLLLQSPEFNWHAWLTTSFCLACKFISKERVFAIDATQFTSRYNAADLLQLEQRAFKKLLPRLALGVNIHERAFVFRTSLLDLAIDRAAIGSRVNSTCLHVLLVDNSHSRLEHEALVRAAAPNATVHCADSCAAARALVNAQAAAGSYVQLVLLGEICSAEAEASERELEALVRDLDPREGSLCADMRSKPLIATLSHSILSRSGHDLYSQGVDAVMAKPLNTGSLKVLLDFAQGDESTAV